MLNEFCGMYFWSRLGISHGKTLKKDDAKKDVITFEIIVIDLVNVHSISAFCRCERLIHSLR